jgi:hypothetical protein
MTPTLQRIKWPELTVFHGDASGLHAAALGFRIALGARRLGVEWTRGLRGGGWRGGYLRVLWPWPHRQICVYWTLTPTRKET